MIAYFILVHRYPEQFKRMFKAIYNSENYYSIHIDKKSPQSLHDSVTSFLEVYSNVHLLKSQNVLWGGYSMVDVELKAIKMLRKISKKWKYYINLSGQDFPLLSQKNIFKFLEKNGKSSFIKIADQIKKRPNTLNRIQNYFLETKNGFVGKPTKRDFLPDTIPYIGGQWKILTRECCDFLSTQKAVKKFIEYYKNTLIPDESFFQTVLMNAGYTGKLVNNDKRAIIWVPDFGPKLLSKKFSLNSTKALIASGKIKLRPKTFTSLDLAFLTKSKALFARKFDVSVDSMVFDILEKKIAPLKATLLVDEITPITAEKNYALI